MMACSSTFATDDRVPTVSGEMPSTQAPKALGV